MPQFTWLTLQQAIDALQGRLQTTNTWPQAELQVYINEGLRAWNSLTEQWNQDFVFTANGATWNNMGTLAGSPRLRTVTDSYLYSQMQSMLLEPVVGSGSWTGTSQFSLAALQFALQRRRDEVIQLTACNLTNLPPLNLTPGTRRTIVGDSTLEIRRVDFVPDSSFGTMPIPLTREDTQAFQFFEPDYLQLDLVPSSWSVASEPPLAFDVDTAPNIPGQYNLVVLQSGLTFAPPAATLLGIPDDWSMVPMYGALADLLSSESERTDTARAAYCLQRYQQGIAAMKQANWLVQANINGVPVDSPSVYELDAYSPFWETNLGHWPTVVQAGIDLCAATPPVSASVDLTLVGNAPIPASLSDFIQLSRDAWDAVLNYCQHIAAWKLGGAEFAATMPLYQNFIKSAVQTNKRLMTYGIFTDVLHSQGQRQEREVTRERAE